MDIYISRDGEEWGPFTRDDLSVFLSRGEVTMDDLARLNVDGEWRSLGEVLAASAPLMDPPEMPPGDLNRPDIAKQEGEPAGSADVLTAGETDAIKESGGKNLLIYRDGEEYGPYGSEDIQALVDQGDIEETDFIRIASDPGWRTINDYLQSETACASSSDSEENPSASAGCESQTGFLRSFCTSARGLVIMGIAGMIAAFAATCVIFQSERLHSIAGPIANASAVASVHPFSITAHPSPGVPVLADVQTHASSAATGSESTKSFSFLPMKPLEDPLTKPLQSRHSTQGPPKHLNPHLAEVMHPEKGKPGLPRQFDLTESSSGGVVRLWVDDSIQNPDAILVLCSGSLSPAKMVKDDGWQKFALTNQLGLAAVSFDVRQPLRAGSGYRFDQKTGDILFAGLDQTWHNKPRIILYGWGETGSQVADLASWHPERLLLWAAYTDKWIPSTLPSCKAPAILACDAEQAQAVANGYQVFSQGRLQDRPWTWLPSGMELQHRKARIDNFIRTYVSDYLASRKPLPTLSGMWAKIGLRRPVSRSELSAARSQITWLPSSRLFPDWLNLIGAPSNPGPAVSSASADEQSSDSGDSQQFLLSPSMSMPEIHPFETSTLTKHDIIDILADRFSVTPVNISESHGERVNKTLKCYEGSFTLDTTLRWNPKVNVIYKIPLRSTTVPGPDASNIVMIGFFPRAEAPPPYVTSASFVLGDFPNPDEMIGKLTSHHDAISKFLWDHFDTASKNILEDMQAPLQQRQAAMIEGMNEVLNGNSVYDSVRFAGTTLSQETIDLLAENPSDVRLIWLNRLLLQDAYPEDVRIKQMVITGTEARGKSNLYRELNYFSDKLGYTTFSVEAVTNPEMMNNPEESYFYGGQKWVDVVFRAQQELIKKYHLRPRKLLLCGMSLGGTFVEHIAAASPERVAAIAIHSAPELKMPQTRTGTAWFLGISRGDSMYSSYDSLYNRLLDLKDNVALNLFPPVYAGRNNAANWYHSESPIASAAARSFLRGVVDSYDSSGYFDVTHWPYVRDRTKPLRIFQTDSLGANGIPEANREYLPSRAFVECLQAVPAPIQNVAFGEAGAPKVKCLVGLPPLGKPKGILLYVHKMIYTDMQTLIDNISFLTDKGYVVIAPHLIRDYPAAIAATLNFISGTDLLKDLPLVCVGYGPEGTAMWHVVSTAWKSSPKAVSLIGFDPGDAFKSKLPLGAGIKCPILFVYDETPLINVATADEAEESLEKVRLVDEFVQKCNERHQPARVVIIPKAAGSTLHITQKAIEITDNVFTGILNGHDSAMNAQ